METRRILSFSHLKWAAEHNLELPKGARIGPKMGWGLHRSPATVEKLTKPLGHYVDDIRSDGEDLLVTPRGEGEELRVRPGDRLRCWGAVSSVAVLPAKYRGPIEKRLGCGKAKKLRYGDVPQSGCWSGFVRHPRGIAAIAFEACACDRGWHSSYCTFWLKQVFATPDRAKHQQVADWLDTVLP